MNNFKRHDYKPSTKAGLFPMNSAYASARHSLIAIIAFTVINLILAFANSGTYFLMSISVPYYLVYLMMEVTGYFPDSYYQEVYPEGVEFLPSALLWIATVIAVVTIAIYVVLYILSKKSPVAYLVATVLFGIDTVILLGYAALVGFVYFLTDIVFHVIVLVLLIKGIVDGFKAKEEAARLEAMAAAAAAQQAAAEAAAAAAPVEAPAEAPVEETAEAPAEALTEAPAEETEAPAEAPAEETEAPAEETETSDENPIRRGYDS